MDENFVTLVNTINTLKEEGYNLDFNIREERVVCHNANEEFLPEYFRIDKVIRFEGASNPDDQAVLYAISSSHYKIKGILVNGYGISADDDTNAIIKKLKIHS